jgi:integrase/recombinase XerD
MGQGRGDRTVTLPCLWTGKPRADGSPRWYVRRKGKDGATYTALPDLPTDHPDFLAAYAAAMRDTAPDPQKRPVGGFKAIMRDAIASQRYKRLSASYRRGLRREWEMMADAYDGLPLGKLEPRHVARDVEKAENPGLRLKAWRFLGPLLPHDPTRAVRPQAKPTEGHEPWTADDIAAFRARWPIGTAPRAAMELLFWTGARISDGVRIGRGNVAPDGVLSFRQQKTGKMAYVPWACALPAYAVEMQPDRDAAHEAIRALPGDHMTFLATAHGRGRSDKALGTMIREAAKAAGLSKSAHGLRKARAVALAQAGATPHQIAAWTGHTTLKEVTDYTAAVDRRKAVMG